MIIFNQLNFKLLFTNVIKFGKFIQCNYNIFDKFNSSQIELFSTIGIGKNRLRKLMKNFYKHVHPDMTTDFPLKAKDINKSSLAELNSYVDALENYLLNDLTNNENEFHETFLLSRSLTFFKRYKSINGTFLANRCSPFIVTLPPLIPNANLINRETLAIKFFRDLDVIIKSNDSQFSDKPNIKNLINPKESTREEFNKLWKSMTQDSLHKVSLYQHDEDDLRKTLARKRYENVLASRLLQKAHKSKNSKKRNIQLKNLDQNIKKKVQERFGTIIQESSKFSIRNDEIDIIEAGYHPELVFFEKNLTEDELEEGKQRLKGSNLYKESDAWLLSSILNVLRKSEPPILIIIRNRDSQINSTKFGSLQIPCNFDIWKFTEYLEFNLDEIKKKRKKIFEEIKKT